LRPHIDEFIFHAINPLNPQSKPLRRSLLDDDAAHENAEQLLPVAILSRGRIPYPPNIRCHVRRLRQHPQVSPDGSITAWNPQAELTFGWLAEEVMGRRWCDVVSTDYVPSLLERGRARAAAEGLSVEFREADAEALCFGDATFDAVVSTFGVMFTPNQDQAAAELTRVCKSGGKIGLANWTPEGFIGQLFKTLGKYLPPPPGAKSPALWGTQSRIAEMFGASAASIKTEKRDFSFRYRSPAHFLDTFRNYYGPMLKAFAGLDDMNQRALANDLLALIGKMNRAQDGTMIVPSEYLEIVIIKR